MVRTQRFCQVFAPEYAERLRFHRLGLVLHGGKETANSLIIEPIPVDQIVQMGPGQPRFLGDELLLRAAAQPAKLLDELPHEEPPVTPTLAGEIGGDESAA